MGLSRPPQSAEARDVEARLSCLPQGVWEILEVDSEPFHPPTRTVHDHERDRPFLRHGVKVVQHFDATRCRNDPDGVVAEFLALMER